MIFQQPNNFKSIIKKIVNITPHYLSVDIHPQIVEIKAYKYL
jgi:hypothetical protein